MMAGAEEEAPPVTFEHTPTWMVAAVCSFIVIISLIFARLLHYAGKVLKKKNQKSLFDALQKIKEELMLLGFIAFLLAVLQGALQKICVERRVYDHWLPCRKDHQSTMHLAADFFTGDFGGTRRLLAGGGASSNYCAKKNKVPVLSIEAVHEIHIFISALAVTHVVLSAVTVVLGLTRINNWRHWEDKIQQELTTANDNPDDPQTVRLVKQFTFIQERFNGFGKARRLYGWLHSFFKQFYGSLTEQDYATMRLGFINKHCPANLKFNFYKYVLRALEDNFKKVVGISWYLWGVVMLFMWLNVDGWHVYFWISWLPVVTLLVVGAKLEHIIVQLAREVAEKHAAVEGNLLVTPSNDLFWFHRPKIILFLIHYILFQNAFEIAYFMWILSAYGFTSCIMGKERFLIPRLVICGIIQILCSYSTLPLYAIVSHMGSSFERAIFHEHVQAGLVGWAQHAKRNTGKGAKTGEIASREGGIQMKNLYREASVE